MAGSISVTSLLTDCNAPSPPMPGGKTPAVLSNPEVITAANFAIKEEQQRMRSNPSAARATLSLVSILSAQQQVVAGMNYNLTLLVKMDGQERQAEATVWWQSWRQPDPYQLTAWEWK